jgi:cyclic pyranopterin phosphate synthase
MFDSQASPGVPHPDAEQREGEGWDTTKASSEAAASTTLNTMAKKAAKLSHYDKAGRARMVDVSAKPATRREATASAFVALSKTVLKALPKNPKGNPLEVARIAGVQAAKKTSELIPMCHPLPLTFIDVITTVTNKGVVITASAATTANTGVEMEALTAASVAALTIYDMTKALDKSITIERIQLEKKSGGKSGDYQRT